MANSVDPDKTALYEPSHLNLHCLQRYMYKSAGMKGLTLKLLNEIEGILTKSLYPYIQ